MSNFTQQLPEWNNPGNVVPQTIRDAGWQVKDKPPASWWNWLSNCTYESLKEIRDYIDHNLTDTFTGDVQGGLLFRPMTGNIHNWLTEEGMYVGYGINQVNAPDIDTWKYLGINIGSGNITILALSADEENKALIKTCINSVWSGWDEFGSSGFIDWVDTTETIYCSIITLQTTINSLPKYLNKNYILYVSSGTVEAEILIERFTGPGTLRIECISSVQNVNNVENIRIQYNSNALIQIQGFTCTIDYDISIRNEYNSCSSIFIMFCFSTEGLNYNENNIGLIVSHSNVIISSCMFSNKQIAIFSIGGGRLNLSAISGSGNFEVFVAGHGGILHKLNAGTITGTTINKVLYSGIIIEPNGAIIPSSSGIGTWGSITGTLSAQTDLQSALDGKLGVNANAVSATTASTLTPGRTIQTNLASTSATTFTGANNITPGVTGTLAVGNGGTGRNNGSISSADFAIKSGLNSNTGGGIQFIVLPTHLGPPGGGNDIGTIWFEF